MWQAQDAFWTDYYEEGVTADTIYDDAWFEARDAEKKVTTNQLYSAMMSAEEEYYNALPTFEAAQAELDKAQAEVDYILHLEQIRDAGSAE